MLPRRAKRPKMGVREVVRRDFPVHRGFVKGHVCCVCGAWPVDFHHVVSRGAGGSDWDGVPLCHDCHMEFHASGIDTFEKRHKIDLRALAAEFCRRTTDKALRLVLRERGREHAVPAE